MEAAEHRRFSAAPDYSYYDIDGGCSSPYVSAPSSPGGGGGGQSGFYYSAPASPTHFILSTAATRPSYNSKSSSSSAAASDASSSFEFDFSSPAYMTSADELFSNGQIRPMKLSAHLKLPQLLPPLIESSDENDRSTSHSRNLKSRARSQRRRTRSMSPNRTTSLEWQEDAAASKRQSDVDSSPRIKRTNPKFESGSGETTASSGGSSRRSSRRWMSLKELMYRSKSEGHKFWGSLSFASPVKEKEKKANTPPLPPKGNREGKKRAVNHSKNSGLAGGKSPHELHYKASRAQAEEMRKKTFLPYRQGLLGYLGFSSSKTCGAMNGFARA